MRRLLLTLLVLGLSAAGALGQPVAPLACPVTGPAPDDGVVQTLQAGTAWRVCWVHDSALVDRFEVRLNGAKLLDVAPSPGQTQIGVTLPALAVGDHTVIVSACSSSAACADSVPRRVVMVAAAPTKPGGLTWQTNSLTWTGGANTARFEVVVDAGASTIQVGVASGQTRQGTTVTLDPSRPHTIVVRACTTPTPAPTATCIDSDPLLLPIKPSQLRLVPSP